MIDIIFFVGESNDDFSEPPDRGGGHGLRQLGGVCPVHDRGRQEQVPLNQGDVQGQDTQCRPVAARQGNNSGETEEYIYIL